MGHDHTLETHDRTNELSEQERLELDIALARVLAGEATPMDLALIDDRRKMGNLRVEGANTIAALANDFTHLPEPPGFDVDEKWRGLRVRIDTASERTAGRWNTTQVDRSPIAPRFRLTRTTALALSAVFMLVFVSYFEWSRIQAKSKSPASLPTIIATRNSQQSTVTLLDGTVVTLNVASRLEVPKDFNAGNRTVRLEGEALFSVTPRSGDAFTVVAGGTPTRVLGTTFSVRKYETDSSVTVAVRDGKVSVRSVVLTANQQAEIGKSDTVWVHAVDSAQFGFATGVLYLDGIPLVQAITELNRWYDADIHLGDPLLAHRNIKASFSAGSISDMAEVLGLVFDARVVVDGKKVILYSKER